MARPRNNDERILGPYQHGAIWRLKRIRPMGGGGSGPDPGGEDPPSEAGGWKWTGKAWWKYYEYPTREDAERVKKKLETRLGPGIRNVGDAIGRYCDHLRDVGNKGEPCLPDVVIHSRYQLETILPNPNLVVTELGKADVCKRLYDQLRNRKMKTGAAPAVDTHRNCLGQAKSLGRYLAEHKVIARSGFEAVKGMGRRKRGKEQPTVDEAVKFLRAGVASIRAGDESALVAMLALVTGGRAEELANRQVRHVDFAGMSLPQMLHLNSKTEAGKRYVKLPALVRAPLRDVCRGKKPTDWLWSPAGRGRGGTGWAVAKIVGALQENDRYLGHGVPLKIEEIATRSGVALETVYTLCPRLVKKGVLLRPGGRGLYSLVPGKTALGQGKIRTATDKPATRRWVLDAVQRLCERAGIPVVTAHGLRGLRKTLATIGGLDRLLDKIAEEAGHASIETTKRHYIKPQALADAEQDAVERVLGISGNETLPIDPNYDPSPEAA